MKNNHLKGVAGVVLAVAAAPVALQAHDLNPPSWRGDPGSTLAIWGFDTAANPTFADTEVNDFGAAVLTVTVGLFGSGWVDQLPGLGTQTGYWDLGGDDGQMEIVIPNRPSSPPESYKRIRVQVTYFQDINQPPDVSVPGASLVNSGTQLVEAVQTGGSWVLGWSDWYIAPNPITETIFITGDFMGSVVDQVVVDTICVVPEPSSYAFAGVLGLAGVWYARRRRD